MLYPITKQQEAYTASKQLPGVAVSFNEYQNRLDGYLTEGIWQYAKEKTKKAGQSILAKLNNWLNSDNSEKKLAAKRIKDKYERQLADLQAEVEKKKEVEIAKHKKNESVYLQEFEHPLSFLFDWGQSISNWLEGKLGGVVDATQAEIEQVEKEDEQRNIHRASQFHQAAIMQHYREHPSARNYSLSSTDIISNLTEEVGSSWEEPFRKLVREAKEKAASLPDSPIELENLHKQLDAQWKAKNQGIISKPPKEVIFRALDIMQEELGIPQIFIDTTKRFYSLVEDKNVSIEEVQKLLIEEMDIRKQLAPYDFKFLLKSFLAGMGLLVGGSILAGAGVGLNLAVLYYTGGILVLIGHVFVAVGWLLFLANKVIIAGTIITAATVNAIQSSVNWIKQKWAQTFSEYSNILVQIVRYKGIVKTIKKELFYFESLDAASKDFYETEFNKQKHLSSETAIVLSNFFLHQQPTMSSFKWDVVEFSFTEKSEKKTGFAWSSAIAHALGFDWGIWKENTLVISNLIETIDPITRLKQQYLLRTRKIQNGYLTKKQRILGGPNEKMQAKLAALEMARTKALHVLDTWYLGRTKEVESRNENISETDRSDLGSSMQTGLNQEQDTSYTIELKELDSWYEQKICYIQAEFGDDGEVLRKQLDALKLQYNEKRNVLRQKYMLKEQEQQETYTYKETALAARYQIELANLLKTYQDKITQSSTTNDYGQEQARLLYYPEYSKQVEELKKKIQSEFDVLRLSFELPVQKYAFSETAIKEAVTQRLDQKINEGMQDIIDKIWHYMLQIFGSSQNKMRVVELIKDPQKLKYELEKVRNLIKSRQQQPNGFVNEGIFSTIKDIASIPFRLVWAGFQNLIERLFGGANAPWCYRYWWNKIAYKMYPGENPEHVKIMVGSTTFSIDDMRVLWSAVSILIFISGLGAAYSTIPLVSTVVDYLFAQSLTVLDQAAYDLVIKIATLMV